MKPQFVRGFLLGFALVQLVIGILFRGNAPSVHPIVSQQQQQQRVLCWIPFRYSFKNSSDPLARTSSEEQIDRIRNTYGELCDKLYFVTQNGTGSPQALFLAHNYERVSSKDLWNQVSRGWFTIGQKHLEEFEWFIKLDVDSFLIPGNLRFHLQKFNPETDRYFGHTIFEQSRALDDVRAQFNVGAGYGISRGLLRKLLPYIVRNSTYNANSQVPVRKRCNELVRWGEDVKFADCLRVVVPGLLPERMQDDYDRHVFLPFEPSMHMMILHTGKMDWFWRGKDMNRTTSLFRSLSTRPVLFHHFKLTRQFHFVDFMIHRVMVDPK